MDEVEFWSFFMLKQYVSPQSFAILVIIVAFYISLIKHREKMMTNPPPGPKGWPFIGSLPSLNFHSERVMYNWNEKYGPVCQVKLGSRNFILLGSIEAVHEAFVKKSEIFSDRLMNSVPPLLGDNGILFINNTNKLKEQRRFGLAALRDFGMGRRSIEPAILEKCEHICERVEEYCVREEAFSIEPAVYESVSSVISKLVFNKNLSEENEEFKRLLKILIEGTPYDKFTGLIFLVPVLKYIPPFSFGYKISDDYNNSMCREIKVQIEEHRKSRDKFEPRDVIDCFLNEMETTNRARRHSYSAGSDHRFVETETSFVHDQLIKLVRDLFLAGSETSSTTFCWLMLYVTLNPEIQSHMHREIDLVLGEDCRASVAKSEKMPYTRAVIQETLRIRPVAPVGIPHVAAKEDTILGYNIPKGSIVVSNIFRIHHDKSVWGDSEKFDPGRHITADGKFIKSPNVIPFSIGARQCLGQQLAIMELFLITATLFQRYHFILDRPDEVDIKGYNMFTLRPNPYKVFAERR
ncbi:cytochrome P450 2U1-like [Styela clava]